MKTSTNGSRADSGGGADSCRLGWHGEVAVEENAPIAHNTYRLRFSCVAIASRIVPGQFLMIRLAGNEDPLLGRPLALYNLIRDSAGKAVGLEVVYVVVGKMTRRLARLAKGESLEVWGPLGNGFSPTPVEHLVMVAGGIGQTPFLTLAQEQLGLRTFGTPPRVVRPAKRVSLCYGALGKEHLAGVGDFEKLGVDIHLSTDDGSLGHHGLVTELITPVVHGSKLGCRIVCCGPEPMMRSTAAIARRLEVPCQVSLESPMACGLGICFSCVVKVRDDTGGWDYRRNCVEGPVFEADRIVFARDR